ncbi:MAG: ABC transporter ATP-binding protein [Desulfococcaceae bacterium]|jgi:ABC-type Fe3+/spermidine/putrescine transport system ATPase subunit|nr:ABC transporter ATP-binding protein [Desulfococcaceae bacterium]
MKTILQIRNICKSFEGHTALRDISLDLDSGHILCLLGPSGCGKTSLLRIIAGLEQADRGQIFFEGNNMAGIPPHRRGFGMMFQEYALFPHKNVQENLAFGLEMQGMDAAAIGRRVQEMLEIVGLQGFGKRDVGLLSGGEKQRVALARSLIPRPRLLMLDEPLGSLDRALRERLISELRYILRQIRVTAVYVTHDQAEAFAIADRIALFDAGCLLQTGKPEDIYRHPSCKKAAAFLGFHNLLEGIMAKGELFTVLGKISLPVSFREKEGTEIHLLLPPEAVCIPEKKQPEPGRIRIRGRVKECLFQGTFYRLRLQISEGQEFSFHLPNRIARPGEGEILEVETGVSSFIRIPADPIPSSRL